MHQITDIVRDWKRSGGGDKGELLERLAGVEGVYVPSHFQVSYKEDGTIRSVEGGSSPRRAILSNLGDCPPPDRPVVPAMTPVHDRVYAEIARGCGVGCRFCQAGYIYRPLRERSVEDVTRSAVAAHRATGHSDITLASLSSGDHAGIVPVLRDLNRELRNETISLSLPSLRACTLRDEVIHEVSGNRKSSFTIAPEAGSDRMLRLINKGITREIVLDTAERTVRKGWSLLKLYFLIGLPTEEDEDVDGIATLANEVCRIGRSHAGRKFRLNVSVSSLVPKPHTPFQWEAQTTVEDVLRKQKRILRALDSRATTLKCHNATQTAVEDLLARGDRRMADVVEKVYRGGRRFDEWNERFSYETWIEAMGECGLDPAFFHRERPEDEVFPWDHIDIGITRRFLLRERHRAHAGRGTPFCREECRVCRSCDDDTYVIREEVKELVPSDDGGNGRPTPQPPEGRHRVRFRYTKTGIYRFLSHLEVQRAFQLALRRSGLPVGQTQGFHPRMKISFGRPLAVGHEGSEEPMEIVFQNPVDPLEAARTLNGELHHGLEIFGGREVSLHGPALDSVSADVIWKIALPGDGTDCGAIGGAVTRFLGENRIVVEQPWKKGKIRTVDIREGVRAITLNSEGTGLDIDCAMTCNIRLIMLFLLDGDDKRVRSLHVRRATFRLEGE